jgi:hypothetical protein
LYILISLGNKFTDKFLSMGSIFKKRM